MSSTDDKRLEPLLRACEKSFRYGASDPEAALTFARKSAEALCRYLYAERVGEPGRMMLDELIARVSQEKLLPGHLVHPLRTIQAFGNYASHAHDGEGIDGDYIVPCMLSQAQVLRWFFTEHLKVAVPSFLDNLWTPAGYRPRPLGGGTVAIASLADVLEWGVEIDKLLEDWLSVDYATIRNLNDNNEGHIEQWVPVVRDHPDCWRLLIDPSQRKVLGYWHFVPLFDDDYCQARAGRFYDVQITSDKLCFLGLPGLYKAYFVGISILQSHRTVANFRLLLDALMTQLTALGERDVFFEEICANAFTPEGISLCKSLQMTHLLDHEEYGKIYVLRLLPLPQLTFLKAYPQFAQYYNACRWLTA